jgi:hypothetical protein
MVIYRLAEMVLVLDLMPSKGVDTLKGGDITKNLRYLN